MVYALAHDLKNAEDALRKGVDLAGDTVDAYAAAAWRNLAALELHLGQPQALDHVARAIAGNRHDIACRVLKARARLLLGDAAAAGEALDEAKYADHAANHERPDAKRVRALGHLQNGQFAEAIQQAKVAIELGDLATINYLITAVAHAGLGEHREALDALAAARATWPKDLLDEGAFCVTAEAGELWFDSAAELYELRRQAEALIRADGASPSAEGKDVP